MKRTAARQWLVPTIQNKLLLVMLLVALVPLLVFGLIAYLKARDALMDQVGERLHSESMLAMSQIERTFAFSYENIRSWAELEVMQAVERGDPEGAISEMLNNYQGAYKVYGTLAAADRDGSVVAAGDVDLVGITVAEANWFKQVLNTKQPHMSPLRLDPFLGGFGVSIALPIFRRYTEDQLIGVLNVRLDWQELLKQIREIEVSLNGQNEKGYAVLIDEEGYVLAAPDFILAQEDGSLTFENSLRVHGKRWWGAANPELLERLLHQPGHRFVRRGELEYLLVNMPAKQFQYIGNTGWSLVLVRDADDALADIAFIRERALSIAGLAVVVIILVAYFLSRQIGKPIARLSLWAKEISHGSLDRSISLRSNDELAHLAQSLDEMRQNLKNYLDELYESKERYRAVMSSIECVVWEARLDPVQVTLVSGHVEHVVGHSSGQVIRMMAEWRDHVHPDHHQKVLTAFEYAVDNGRDNYVECKVRRKDGQWLWVKALISVVLEGITVTRLRGVIVDINDTMKAAEDMADARDMAIKTAQDKTRFMAIVSHEIRTPMNGILGMLDVFNDNGISREQKQALDMARRSGRNLLSLVDDVMDYARMESGQLQFSYEEINIHDVFNSALNLVAVDAYRKGLDIGGIMEASLPQLVVTDPTKLRQLLTGLLANAVKFTHHGSILVWAELLPNDRLYVEVKDTGVGVDAQRQKDLFAPFVQEDGSTTRQYGGSGLGLALCRGIAQAMGGEVGVKSIKGVGSSFYFELPVEVPPDQLSPVMQAHREFQALYDDAAVLLVGDVPATQMVMQMACRQWGLSFHWEPKEGRLLRNLETVLSEQNYRWVFIAQEISDRFWQALGPYLSQPDSARVIQLRLPTDRYGQRPLPHIYVPFTLTRLADCLLGRSETAPANGLASSQLNGLPRVLVVDDNEVNRRVACGYLRKLGFSADIAEDGQQALDAVKQNRYGMVFMDCQMPVMDGYQSTREIRKYLDGKPLPIIAVTANAMEGDREKCLASGMDDYLAKPLRMDSVKQVAEHWVTHKQRASG